MTAATHTPHTTPTAGRVIPRRRMEPNRRISLTAGILYVLTFVSIPTLGLYKPVKDHVGTFILGAGSDTGVLWGAASEVIVGIAGIGTAVVLYPIAKRVSQTAALGFVTARLLETCLIFVGVISLLTIITLRTDVAGTAGANSAALVTTGHGLVAVYTWTFLLSQSLMPVACDLLLGYVLYRSGLVPRILPIVAFVGAPLLLASDIAVFFGAYPNVSPVAALAALPVAAFELSLGLWLIVKGFEPTPLTSTNAPSTPFPDGLPVA
ncbi:DUF4386 domain-containing protein [Segeticoccus rhizosphaerae]|uniref:DUF4386 domain-containing protein n=1 Tax=Segeticoccus rhizosphaerae TaxID=1104777 RepID=UPI00193A1E3A|nr:DUF4386 domain-containing protein [Segeticoccus rhizosphaerae]